MELAMKRLWQGLPGCVLADRDLLFLVSCAVGRIRQEGEDGVVSDVTGLYARVAGARSVIAARWPINEREASLFASVYLSRYLEQLHRVRARGLHSLENFARARLLAETRKELTSPDPLTGETRVGRSLAHSFELYGLG